LQALQLRMACLFTLSFLPLLAACSSGGDQPSIPDGGAPIGPISGGGAVPVSPVASPTDQPGSTPTSQPNVSTVSSSIPKHIATWATDEFSGQGGNATSADVQRYVSYAEGGEGNEKAERDCSGSTTCSSVFYLQPNLIESNQVCSGYGDAGFAAAASENWYVHRKGYTDLAHRLVGYRTIDCRGDSAKVPEYLADDSTSGVQSYFRSYVEQHADDWDYLMIDSTGWDVIDQAYGPSGGLCPWEAGAFCTTTEELPTNSSIVAEHGAFATALVHKDGSPFKAFTNGIDGYVSQEMSASNHYVGGLLENLVVDEGNPRPSVYAEVLVDMARADATPGAKLVELDDGSSPSGSAAQIEQRIITTAVAWLGYSEGHTIVFANLESKSNNLAVWPEDMIYPAQPLETMSSGPNDIEIAPNAWRREFAACYNDGVAIGPCASIVNGSGSPVLLRSVFFRQSYGHVITPSGGDALSGGTVSVSATPVHMNAQYIPAGEAVLLSR
jgi:hypothetical protein